MEKSEEIPPHTKTRMEPVEPTYFIMIGNSDDKLTQREWGSFCRDTVAVVESNADQIYGMWYSLPGDDYQNACFAFAMRGKELAVAIRRTNLYQQLRRLAGAYRQDSIALAVSGGTEFIRPSTLDRVVNAANTAAKGLRGKPYQFGVGGAAVGFDTNPNPPGTPPPGVQRRPVKDNPQA